MKSLTPVALIVLAALIALPLAGCRTSRRAASQPVAAQPAPSTSPPTVRYQGPPSVVSRPAVPSAPSTGWSSSAPTPPPPTSWPEADGGYAGTPDGSGGYDDGGIVYDVPSMPGQPAAPEVATAIAEEREARVRLDQELVELRERLRRTEQVMQAPAPAAVAVGADPMGGAAGAQQAQRFAQALRAKGAQNVEVRGSEVMVRFTDVFEAGSEQLKRGAGIQATLLAAAGELVQYPGAVVEVVGHSDGQPIKVTRNRWKDNVHLSRERAQTVANALAKAGVPASRLAVNGRGSVEPLVFPEKSAADRARNRRVELRVRF